MLRRSLFLVALVPLACSSGRTPSNASADAAVACATLRDSWAKVVAGLDRQCTAAADCTVPDDCHGCWTYPYLGFGAAAVNASAYNASSGPGAAIQFHRECDEIVGPVADCGDAIIECVAGKCQLKGRECCGCPAQIDAGNSCAATCGSNICGIHGACDCGGCAAGKYCELSDGWCRDYPAGDDAGAVSDAGAVDSGG